MSSVTMTTDCDTKVCAQCGNAEAKFYSLHGNDRTLFCSSECHKKFIENMDSPPNALLVELDENSDNENDNETEVNEVFMACHRGQENLKKLQSQLQLYGENPNQVNAKGQTPLTYAIAKGDVRTLDLLLLAGAEIDAEDDNGDTALMVAAQLESEIKVEYLLEKGAQPNIADIEGKTALYRTEQNKTTKCAKLLIDKDSSLVHTTDKHKQTILHLSAGEGNDDLVRYLLERDSKRNDLDNLGRTPLHWAVIQGMKSSVEILLEGEGENGAIDVRDKFGFYPIHCAVQINRPDIARVLVDKGCNLGVIDFAARSPFVFAASLGHQEICQVILEKHDEMNESDRDGFTALHFAASRGDSALCRLLLNQGANADPTNRKRETPLHLATTNEHKDVVEILLNNGSRGVSMTDQDERTSIHQAADCDFPEILKILVSTPTEQGKENTGTENDSKEDFKNVLDMRDRENHTALYLAASREHRKCCEVLLERGCAVDEESRPYLVQMGLVEEAKEEEGKEEEGKEEESKEEEAKEKEAKEEEAKEEEAKEKEAKEEEAKEKEAKEEATKEEVEEDGGAMTTRERYAPSVSPPMEEPPIQLSPVTDREVVANTSRHIHDDVMSTRSSKSSRRSRNKADSWKRFMAQKKQNKNNMMQAHRSIPEYIGSPYLIPQVNCDVFRRYLIGHRTAHDIYSEEKPTDPENVYASDGRAGKYSYSQSAPPKKPYWKSTF